MTKFASWQPTVALAIVTALCMTVALAGALLYAPNERLQGAAQRIFYFHVPLAWSAYLAFTVVFVASIVVLVRRSEAWDRVAVSSAEIGLLFTTLVLVTGSLWARPIWGTWWSWDARLTTTLFLWFIYVGYLMVRGAITDERRAMRFSAAIGIIGFVDIPIIHQSVVWWRTLHPESIVLGPGGPAMPASMQQALWISTAAFVLVYATLLVLRVRVETLRHELRVARLGVL
jgi:heme exporter protein C